MNYVLSVSSEVVQNCQTPFRFFVLEYELTEEGVTSYKKVLALTFEYLNIVLNQWLDKS